MMKKQFTEEQIRAYAAQFREGDAIYITNVGWGKLVFNCDGYLMMNKDGMGNSYPVRNSGGGAYVSGFTNGEVSNPFRVTTLEHYELQGGEKIVWLGKSDDFRTFGKVYKTEDINNFTCDKGYMGWGVSGLYWGIIPRYEQVKNFGKEDDEVSEIKVVEESNYTGKFKVGDEVKVVSCTRFEETGSLTENLFRTGEVIEIDIHDEYSYRVSFVDGVEDWFSESTLELVSKRKDDSMDALQYVAKLYAEATSKSATHVSDGMLKLSRTSDEVDRPASSHYHIDNNGNDVWKFADDNLSVERVKGFHQINAIKYISRYEKKHDTKEKRIEDLEKAKVSIDKLIELEGLE